MLDLPRDLIVSLRIAAYDLDINGRGLAEVQDRVDETAEVTGKRPEDVTDIPTRLTATNIGTMTLAFADGEHGTFTYNVFGTAGTKQITRNVFSSPQTQCR